MILALLLLVAAFIVFFDLIQPAYGDLQKKKGQQLNNQNLFDNERVVVDQAKKLLSQYESVSQTKNDLSLAMPSGPNVANALAQLFGIAQNNSIMITNVSVSPPAAAQRQGQQAKTNGTSTSLGVSQIIKPLGVLSFQIVGNGSYESFKSFLAQMETNIRVFDVTSLAVQAAPTLPGVKGGVQNFFTYTLTIVTYYQIL